MAAPEDASNPSMPLWQKIALGLLGAGAVGFSVFFLSKDKKGEKGKKSKAAKRPEDIDPFLIVNGFGDPIPPRQARQIARRSFPNRGITGTVIQGRLLFSSPEGMKLAREIDEMFLRGEISKEDAEDAFFEMMAPSFDFVLPSPSSRKRPSSRCPFFPKETRSRSSSTTGTGWSFRLILR